MSLLNRPIQDREIKVFARMDNESPEVDFTDRPDGIQVRCRVFSEGTRGYQGECTG